MSRKRSEGFRLVKRLFSKNPRWFLCLLAACLVVAVVFLVSVLRESPLEGYWRGYLVVSPEGKTEHYPVILHVEKDRAGFRGAVIFREAPSNFVVDTPFSVTLSVEGNRVRYDGRSEDGKATLSFDGIRASGRIIGKMKVFYQNFFFDIIVREGNLVLSR